MRYLNKGEKGLYINVDGKFFFPDRNCNLQEGIIDDFAITNEKEKYGFFTAKNVKLTVPSNTEVMDIISSVCKKDNTVVRFLILTTFKEDSYYQISFDNEKIVDVAKIDGILTVIDEFVSHGFNSLKISAIDKLHSSIFERVPTNKIVYFGDILSAVSHDEITPDFFPEVYARSIYGEEYCLKKNAIWINSRLFGLTKFVAYKGTLFIDSSHSDKPSPGTPMRPLSELKDSISYGIFIGNRHYGCKKISTDDEDINAALNNSIIMSDNYKGLDYVWISHSCINEFDKLPTDVKDKILTFIKKTKEATDTYIKQVAKKGLSIATISDLSWGKRINDGF